MIWSPLCKSKRKNSACWIWSSKTTHKIAIMELKMVALRNNKSHLLHSLKLLRKLAALGLLAKSRDKPNTKLMRMQMRGVFSSRMSITALMKLSFRSTLKNAVKL